MEDFTVENIDKALTDFACTTSVRSKWLYFKGFKAYVRKSIRCHNGTIYYSVFNIASVEVDETGQGRFKLFLQVVLNRHGVVFVENILTERFNRFFEVHPLFERYQPLVTPPSYITIKNKTI